MPLGEIDEGDRTYLLRSQGQFENLQQIRDLVVMTRAGVPVYLKDIAEVNDATEDFRSEDDSRVDVRDYQGNVLLTVTAAARTRVPATADSPIRLNEWSREAQFAADLARWAEEQRAIIRELENTGRDVSTAEDLLKSITNLYAGKVAARILKRVARTNDAPADRSGAA